MAIAAAMRGMEVQRTDIDTSINNNEEELVVIGRKVVEEDGHENDLVMPGFRFHPTEEELIEFYLRRKVEGKRFNVDLITFLDLYRYDPWELPALATIGEKEWFFYVPRDRKYRNGDRPNRVTTSGYWKATGADRTIRSDQSSRSIGLKKTLVFYSGKAPKGIRTAWIMNEYRLPHSNTDQYNKGEISLCRVYKRASDPSHLLPATLPSKPSSSSNTSDPTTSHKHHKSPPPPPPPPIFTSPNTDKIPKTTQDMPSIVYNATTTTPIPNTISATSIMEEEQVGSINLHHPKSPNDMVSPTIDELNRIVGYNQSYLISNNNQQIHILPSLPSQPQLAPLTVLQPNSLPTIPDKLWEWSSLPETGGWKRI